MTTDEAIAHFGGKQALWEALALKGKRGTIQNWGERPPMLRQYQLEVLTNGRLRADDFAERRKRRAKPRPVKQEEAAT